jgi:hypothetical protein
VILFATFWIIASVSYRIGKASTSNEITATLKEIDSLRQVIHNIKSSQHLSVGNHHPAGKFRLVRPE